MVMLSLYIVCVRPWPQASALKKKEERRMSEENDSVGKVLAAQAETFI